MTRLALPARSPAGDFGDVALSDADLAWAEGISGHRLRGQAARGGARPAHPRCRHPRPGVRR